MGECWVSSSTADGLLARRLPDLLVATDDDPVRDLAAELVTMVRTRVVDALRRVNMASNMAKGRICVFERVGSVTMANWIDVVHIAYE